jgi:hypothetical protein
MIDENFYQKRVDELKRSLKSQTVFINESFSGGLFRTSAKPILSELSIYHLLRGLEIKTDEETYIKLQSMLPICKDVFNPKDSETLFSVGIVEKELEYIKTQLVSIQSTISEEVASVLKDNKDNKEDISKFKVLINSLKGNETLIEKYLTTLTETIKANQTGLKDAVYEKIDNMGLKTLKPESFGTGSYVWLKEKNIDDTIDAKLNDNNPIVRISMLLELVLKTMNIDGLKFISSESPYDYLVSIIGFIESKITPSKLVIFKELIDTISKDIFKNQIDLIDSQHKKSITIPTLQSLFISFITVIILKAIASASVEAVKGEEKKEQPKSLLSEKVQVKAKGIFTAFDELDKLGFFKSEKVFYEKPRKSYTLEEGNMIVQLKKLFKEMGFISESSAYMIRKSFDSQILGLAVKDFQSNVRFNDKPLTADGRIGKTTRLVLATFVDDLKKRNQGEPVQTKAQTEKSQEIGIKGTDTVSNNLG